MGAGVWSAVMAEAAEGPEPAVAMGCGRAFVMPDTGSVLDAGHSPLGAFLRAAAQVEPSAAGEGAVPFGCDEAVEMVDEDEACEESDDDELERWALLRGMNILKSSVAMEGAPLGTPLVPLHLDWKFGGGATAVIDSVCAARLPAAGGRRRLQAL